MDYSLKMVVDHLRKERDQHPQKEASTSTSTYPFKKRDELENLSNILVFTSSERITGRLAESVGRWTLLMCDHFIDANKGYKLPYRYQIRT